MSKFTRTLLISFSGCIFLGVILILAGWLLGFRGYLTKDMASVSLYDVNVVPEGEIHNLVIDAQAGTVTLSMGDTYAITEVTDDDACTSEVSGDTWYLTLQEPFHGESGTIGDFYVGQQYMYLNTSLSEIHVTIPTENCPDSITIRTKTGTVYLDQIKAGSLGISLETGTIVCNADIAGVLSIDCQGGHVTGTLAGQQSQYNMDLDCDFGAVEIGDIITPPVMAEENMDYGMERTLIVNCDAGEVRLSFQQSSKLQEN